MEVEEASTSNLPKSKVYNEYSPSHAQPSSPFIKSPKGAKEGDKSKAAVPGVQVIPQSSSKDVSSAPDSSKVLSQQKLSVADLRRSFENVSKPVELSGTHGRPDLHSKSSLIGARQSHEMLRPSSLKYRTELSTEKPFSFETTSVIRPLQLGNTKNHPDSSERKIVGPTSPASKAGDSVGRGPTTPIRTSSRFIQQQQQPQKEEPKSLQKTAKRETISHSVSDRLPQGHVYDGSCELSMDSSSGVPTSEQRMGTTMERATLVKPEHIATEDACDRMPLRAHKDKEAPLPGKLPPQASGKVAQLRILFERSARRVSSSLSMMQLRARQDTEVSSDERKAQCSTPGQHGSESPMSPHTVAHRQNVVPSLTTQISVNDFFCDFVGKPLPREATDEREPQTKQESPVKHRIRQFEHLSRDSLAVRAATDVHGKMDEAGLLPLPNREGDKLNRTGAWRPIHLRGATFWRKISSSFSRSLDSWKDCNSGNEQINLSGAGSRDSPDRSASAASVSRRHHRHSSSFGYRLYRVSHRSRRYTSSSYAASSIHLSGGESPKPGAARRSNASFGHSSPGTPLLPLSIRKSVPIMNRLSSGYSLPSDSAFGLDGHMMSKHEHEHDEEFSQPEATTSGPSTPQGDPNALLKVMLKQSTAEPDRGKQDDKYLRRNKKPRSLGRWKGRVKSSVADPALDPAETKKLDKGKGKEKEVTKENEGQTSKDQENVSGKKTASGFVVFETKDVKLRHPKPSRPGQVRKMANMYKDKEKSGLSINTKASSGTSLQGFRRKASSALGLGGYKASTD